MKHETTLVPYGTNFTWTCTCGRGSRHRGPLQDIDRNAKAHERKYNAKVK